jgi:hypothetical protein
VGASWASSMLKSSVSSKPKSLSLESIVSSYGG